MFAAIASPNEDKLTVLITVSGSGSIFKSCKSCPISCKLKSAFDAGLFYCPYVPLQMVRAVGENSFQPKIGFKTRYGMVANTFAQGATQGLGAITADTNTYYRKVTIANLF